MKKSISLILALIMLLSAFAGLDFSAYATDIPSKIGSNITVTYDSTNKVLTLSGKGAIADQEESPFIDCFDNNFNNKIVISSGITSIGAHLFEMTTAFTELEIADTVTAIGEFAFNTTRIAEFNIPASVTSIGNYALGTMADQNKKIKNLKNLAINVDENNETYCSVDGVLFSKDMKTLIQAPCAFGGTDGEYVVPDGVEHIGKAAFLVCLNLKKVTIPESVELINEDAFSLCKNLTEITFGRSQKLVINYSAFTYNYYDSATQQTSVVPNNENMLFKVYPSTSALTFAKNNSINYELIEPEPIQTGWVKVDGKWYFYDENGVMQKGWLKDGGKWYFLDSSGVMKTGWIKSGGKWYYLAKSGAMTTGWQKVGNYWYYMNKSGAMQTGWIKLSGKWYYLNTNGSMRTANLTYKGKVYKFNKSGVCLNP